MNNATNFTVQDFEPSDVVSGIAASPRFGHPSEFDALFGSSSDQKSYLIGVVIAGIIVASIAVLWGLLLLVLMCCGPENVGFLSGRPFRSQLPPEATTDGLASPSKSPNKSASSSFKPQQQQQQNATSFDSDDDLKNADDNSLRKDTPSQSRPSSASTTTAEFRSSTYTAAPSCSNRPTRIRSAFLVCGIIFVTFSILLVTQGLSRLQTTIDVLQDSTSEVNRLSSDAVDILENGFLKAGAIATTVRDEIELQLDGGAFCPNDPSLENSLEGKQFRTEAMAAVGQLDQLGDFMASNIGQLLDPLQRTIAETAYFESKIAPIDLTDWRAMLALIPYTIVPALLMGGVLMALFDVSLPGYICVLNWVLLPLFVLLVILAWVVASGMIVAGGMNGDFCLPGGYYEGNPPDGTIRNIMAALGYNLNSTEYEIVDFYISQCRQDDPFGFVESAEPQLLQAQSKIVDLAKLFANPTLLSALSLYCNRDYTDLQQLVSNMDSLIALLMDSVLRTMDLIDCDRIVPLYTATVYGGMCTYAPSAVFWVFACCLLLGLSGMLMITFRSSYKLTRYEEDPSFAYNKNDDDLDAPRTQDDNYDDDGPNESVISDDLYLSDHEQPPQQQQQQRPSHLRGAGSYQNDSYDDDDSYDVPPPERAPGRYDDDEEEPHQQHRQRQRDPPRSNSPF